MRQVVELRLEVAVAEADAELLAPPVVVLPHQRGAAGRARDRRVEQRRGAAARDRVGEVAERRGAGRSPAERERSVEVAEPGAGPGPGHAHGAAERPAVDRRRSSRRRASVASRRPPGARGTCARTRPARLPRPRTGRGRGAGQHDPVEVAALAAVGQGPGEKRPGDSRPGRVVQVDDRGRDALGGQLLADGLRPKACRRSSRAR